MSSAPRSSLAHAPLTRLQLLAREYGPYLTAAEDGYNATIEFDLTAVPDDAEAWAHKAARLKRNCLAAPFEKFFALQAKGGSDEAAVVHYRDDESFVVRAAKDRTAVVFSTKFSTADDVILGKVFLQVFLEVRRN